MATPARLVALDTEVPRRRSRRQKRAAVLSPDDMLIFAAVIREGGVRRGALALDIPRSTVSRQLAGLERTLGGQLVARTTRRFALTELGRSLEEQCARLEEVLKTTSEVVARTAREPSGTLRVAASPIVGEEFLPGVIARYLERFPRVSVDVQLSVDFVDVRRGGFDVAIQTGPLQSAGDLFATRLGVSLKGLYASRSYLKARGTPETVAELTQHNCIVVGGKGRASWSFRSNAGDVEVPVTGSLRVDSYRLACGAAVEGVGIARIPTVYAREVEKRGVLVPILEGSWPRTTLSAVHAAGPPTPPKIRAFIDLLRAEMKRFL